MKREKEDNNYFLAISGEEDSGSTKWKDALDMYSTGIMQIFNSKLATWNRKQRFKKTTVTYTRRVIHWFSKKDGYVDWLGTLSNEAYSLRTFCTPKRTSLELQVMQDTSDG